MTCSRSETADTEMTARSAVHPDLLNDFSFTRGEHEDYNNNFARCTISKLCLSGWFTPAPPPPIPLQT